MDDSSKSSEQSRAPETSLAGQIASPGEVGDGYGGRPVVNYSPSEIVRRRFESWTGLTVETAEVTRLTPFEYRFRSPCHLLIAAELAEREDGETRLEGVPRSNRRVFTRKLTFVPAGHDFHGSQKPRVRTRITCVYIEPRELPVDPALRFDEIQFKPRLFFYEHDIWETVLKFKATLCDADPARRQYGEALVIMLAHELARLEGATRLRCGPVDGGLAGWQQRRVADYIEEHVADGVALSTLAQQARLSPYHFCRSFKRSFGVSPHRYHAMRRIERAKQLLARRDLSITAIALAVGFGDTSTFTAAYHRLTGQTPSQYRRDFG